MQESEDPTVEADKVNGKYLIVHNLWSGWNDGDEPLSMDVARVNGRWENVQDWGGGRVVVRHMPIKRAMRLFHCLRNEGEEEPLPTAERAQRLLYVKCELAGMGIRMKDGGILLEGWG